MKFDNVYFINGTAYAGKSTMVKLLAEKYNGIVCEENYHNQLSTDLDSQEFPGLTYTRDLQNWSDFIRRTPDEYEAWIQQTTKEYKNWLIIQQKHQSNTLMLTLLMQKFVTKVYILS